MNLVICILLISSTCDKGDVSRRIKGQQSRVSWEILYDIVELVIIGDSEQLNTSLS